MALVNKPDYSVIWSEGGARTAPSNAKISTGWTSEIPPFQWENFIQNRQDQAIKYLFQRGISEWSASEDYIGGGLSLTMGSDGNVYKSVQTNGPTATVVNPVTNTSLSHWTPITKLAGVGVPGLVDIATMAEQVAGLSETKVSTPAGIGYLLAGLIGYFPFNTPPEGWLVADGSAISRTVYARLFARVGTRFGIGNGSTTFNLPDLRGIFIRGWDNGRGVDVSRAFGTEQDSQNLSHVHTGSTSTSGAHNHRLKTFDLVGSTGSTNPDFQPSGDDGIDIGATATAGAHSHSLTINSSGGNESRPRNIALLPCIKY